MATKDVDLDLQLGINNQSSTQLSLLRAKVLSKSVQRLV